MSDSEYRKELRRKHKEAGLCCFCDRPVEPSRSACSIHLQKQREKAQARQSRRLLAGLCRYCTSPSLPNKQYCISCQQKFKNQYAQDSARFRVQARQNYQSRYAALKVDVYAAYGNQCRCCKEKQEAFFTLDHINDDGNVHRQMLKTKGAERMLTWVKENNYPDSIQLLCANCHLAKTRLGYCPHQVVSS